MILTDEVLCGELLRPQLSLLTCCCCALLLQCVAYKPYTCEKCAAGYALLKHNTCGKCLLGMIIAADTCSTLQGCTTPEASHTASTTAASQLALKTASTSRHLSLMPNFLPAANCCQSATCSPPTACPQVALPASAATCSPQLPATPTTPLTPAPHGPCPRLDLPRPLVSVPLWPAVGLVPLSP
jgi:hypothetical protein